MGNSCPEGLAERSGHLRPEVERAIMHVMHDEAANLYRRATTACVRYCCRTTVADESSLPMRAIKDADYATGSAPGDCFRLAIHAIS